MHKPTLRVLVIFEEIRNSLNGLTMTEISNKTKIPMSTLSPIMKTLVENNFLEIKDNKYLIGFCLYKVGNIYRNKSQALSIVRVYMEKIVEECNEICQLGIYENKMVFYLEKVEPKQSIKIVSNVGSRIPAYAPALGKSLLSQFPDEYIINIFDDKMQKITNNTTINIDELLTQIKFVRKNGFIYEYGEISTDIRCVATPLIVNEKVVAALSISIPLYRADEDNLNKCRNVLLKYKTIIESSLQGMEINF